MARGRGGLEEWSVIGAANTSGTIIPPHIIRPGKTRRTLQGYGLENILEDWTLKNVTFSESGWTKDGIDRLTM